MSDYSESTISVTVSEDGQSWELKVEFTEAADDMAFIEAISIALVQFCRMEDVDPEDVITAAMEYESQSLASKGEMN